MPVWIVKACCQFDCSMKSLYLVSELDKRMEDVESKESEDEISNASIEPTVTEDVVDEDCSQETTKRSRGKIVKVKSGFTGCDAKPGSV